LISVILIVKTRGGIHFRLRNRIQHIFLLKLAHLSSPIFCFDPCFHRIFYCSCTDEVKPTYAFANKFTTTHLQQLRFGYISQRRRTWPRTSSLLVEAGICSRLERSTCSMQETRRV